MKVDIKQPILKKNNELAEKLREKFRKSGVLVINLMASPGSGKTSTILSVMKHFSNKFKIAVIEGDIASDVDAQKIKKFGAQAVQINTGGACHLESNMISMAVDKLDLEEIDFLFIENVGNLVCPVDFDLGEDIICTILSVPEGDDKPLKYPGIFQACDSIIVNKIDVLEHFTFDNKLFTQHINELNPNARIFGISATKDVGVEDFCGWLENKFKEKLSQKRNHGVNK